MGSILITMGICFGCVGKKIFGLLSSLVVAVTVGIMMLYLIVSFTTWNKTTWSFLLILLVIAAITIVITLLLKQSKYFSSTITCLGCILGFHVGNYLYALIYQVSGWESLYGFLSIVLTSVIVTGLLSFKKRYSELYLTSLLASLGGFCATRGLSLICGGYPIETVQFALLRNEMPLEIEPIVWGYFVISLVISAMFTCWLGCCM